MCSLLLLLTAAVSEVKPGLREIISRLVAYTRIKPAEKVFVHMDRTRYSKGESIWFSVYLFNATNPAVGANSEVVYVELFDEKNLLVDRKVLYAPEGVAAGDFIIPDSIATGVYAIRAYTNYMKNFDAAWFFTKSISVVSPESKGDPESPAGAKLKLLFFPEGGTFVASVENRVAFKCTDAEGAAVEVRGKILDSHGRAVASYATEHAGMGIVKLLPEAGESYKALLETEGEPLEYPLPQVESSEYAMRVRDFDDSIRVVVVTNEKSLLGRDAFLIVQTNGVPRFSARGKFVNGSLIAFVNKKLFPPGVAQITLLDDDLIPRCERLVFINRPSPSLTVDFNKKLYDKREKIIGHGSIKDDKGLPLQGNISVSVVDAKAESSPEKYPANIKSTLLLTSDLRGTISDPGYYFKDSLRVTRDHLDLLMMVHGWRRFTWKEVLADSQQNITFFPEKGIRISGRVEKPGLKKNIKSRKVKILTPGAELIEMKINYSGEFSTDQLIYYDSAELTIETDDSNGQPRDMPFELFDFTPSPPKSIVTPMAPPRDPFYLLNQIDNNRRITNAIRVEQGNTLLEDLVVKSSRITGESKNEVTALTPLGRPSNRLTSNQLQDGAPNIVEAMMGKIPGVGISGDISSGYSISVRGLLATIFFDGIRVDANFLGTVNKAEIDRIDVIKEGGYGTASGPVIAVFSKRSGQVPVNAPGIRRIKYPGLYRAREFYSPDYSVENKLHAYPDFRTTVYWNPAIQTDANGNFEFSFYSADAITTYQLTIEGMTVSKFPITATAATRVEQ